MPLLPLLQRAAASAGAAFLRLSGGTMAGNIDMGGFDILSVGAITSNITAHGNTGATETFDCSVTRVHTATLDQSSTFTLSGSAASKYCEWIIAITQDGTGGRVITWPAAVTNRTTLLAATQANGVTWFRLWTTDAGTTIQGEILSKPPPVATVYGAGSTTIDFQAAYNLGYRTVGCFLRGAGGGGGSGRRGITLTNRAGGSGGAGGAYTAMRINLQSLITAGFGTLNLTVGAGGAGAVAVTTDATNGNAGTAGGDTYLGAALATSILVAGGGGGGAGGSTTGGGASTGGAGQFTGAAGGSAAAVGTNSNIAGPGGGGAGGLTNIDVETVGMAGGAINGSYRTASAGGAASNPGTPGFAGYPTLGLSGTGGGGGGGSLTAPGQGAVGGMASGGGGSAGTANGVTAPVGGAGGDGSAIIVFE